MPAVVLTAYDPRWPAQYEAERYAALKRKLAGRYGNQRDVYTERKGPFVEAVIERARARRLTPARGER